MMEIERDVWIEMEKVGTVGTYVYIPSNYPGPIAINATIHQPERLNPENHISSWTDMICDSLSSMET